MVPTPADIARYRYIAAAAVRGVGLLLLIFSATRLSVYLWVNVDGIARQLNAGTSIRRHVSSMSLHTVLLVFAALATTRPVWIARWLVPARVKPACPVCGFNLQGLCSESCPECGTRLGPEFFEQPDARPGGMKEEGGVAE